MLTLARLKEYLLHLMQEQKSRSHFGLFVKDTTTAYCIRKVLMCV